MLTPEQIKKLEELGFRGEKPYIKTDYKYSIHQYSKGRKVFSLGDGSYSQFKRIQSNDYPEWVMNDIIELEKAGLK